MPFIQSKKVIFISKARDIEENLKQVLGEHGLSIATAYPSLYSLEEIQTVLIKTGTTTFIRNELMRFIKETGFPYAIIIDSQIDINDDPLKILKTLLISYIILTRGHEFDDLKGNFILRTQEDSFTNTYKWDTSPHCILDILHTSNEAVNSFITELKKDKKKFNSRFFIKFLNSTASIQDMALQIDTIIKAIEARNKFTAGSKTGPLARESIAAKILYRIDSDLLYNDGTIQPVENQDIEAYKEGEFYIIGHWSNKTLLEVSGKLQKAITRGLADRKRFKKDEVIIINMDDRCAIDSTTATSLAQLIIKGLTGFTNVSVELSSKNYENLKLAQGFSMIKNVVHEKS